MNERPNRKWRAAMRDIDPGLSVDDDAYPVAVCLLAAANVGNKTDALVVETGYPRRFLGRLRQTLIRNGVFTKDGKVRAGDWSDPKGGGISFWRDVSVGLGLLKRVA